MSRLRHRVKTTLAAYPTVAVAATRALRLLAMERYASALARVSQATPEWVPVHIGAERRPVFNVRSVGGTDVIARNIWREGWHGFERPLPDMMVALARSVGDSLLLDVGANTGFYSLLATAVNPKLSVHAFEPFPLAARIMDDNLRANHASRVRTFEVAISEASGTASLYVPLQDHGLVETSCSLNADFKDAHSGTVEVRKTTVDEHLAQHAPEARVSLMKIDVEGHENEVLRGARNTIAKHRPVIVYEVLEKIDTVATNQFMREHGYVSYKIENAMLLPEGDIRCIFRVEAWNHIAVPAENPCPQALLPFFR